MQEKAINVHVDLPHFPNFTPWKYMEHENIAAQIRGNGDRLQRVAHFIIQSL